MSLYVYHYSNGVCSYMSMFFAPFYLFQSFLKIKYESQYFTPRCWNIWSLLDNNNTTSSGYKTHFRVTCNECWISLNWHTFIWIIRYLRKNIFRLTFYFPQDLFLMKSRVVIISNYVCIAFLWQLQPTLHASIILN